MSMLMGGTHASKHAPYALLTSIAVLAVGAIGCKSGSEPPPDPIKIDPPSELCPDIDPITGPYTMKGACCYRESNKRRLDASTSGVADLEFRIMASHVVTQPLTIGSPLFVDYVQRSYDLNRSVSLIRIHDLPTEGPGDVVIETGAGRFNTDGTYSFLKDAAPPRPISDDPARWDSVSVPARYDPAAPEGERFVPVDPRIAPRLLLTPEWQPNGDLDYELTQVSPRVLSMTFDEDLNCIGERGDQTRWLARDEIESFIPIEYASMSRLSAGWSLCTSLAFGYVAATQESCEASPREEWVETPTALCGNSVCYVGDPSDPAADCRTDPDAVGDARPICCDPLGADTVLPACNAFHVVARYVAAAVEITDQPVSDGAPRRPDEF